MVKAYRVYYQYEDEWEGYTDDMKYFMDRDDAELWLLAYAEEKFPDSIEIVNWRGVVSYIQNTKNGGKDYYHIEEIKIE